MDYYMYDEKLSYLLEMVKKGRLLSPRQAATAMACSRRTVFRMLGHLKSKGFDIRYSRIQKRYYLIR